MKIPERYKTPLLALLASLMALAGLLSADIAGDGTPPSTTEPPTTVPETTTTVAPTTTTTVQQDPPFADVDITRWLVDGRNEGVSDDAWHPSGNFRMHCEFSHLAYADPIVAPGVERFGHLHMFFGNDTVDGDTTWDSLVRDGEGTCPGGPLNRTGYWMPAVFDANGNVAIPSSFELYYKGENYPSGSVASKAAYVREIQPYPDGLRMISDQAAWKCGDGNYQATIPRCNGQRLTVQVRFPYCWNGRDLDSADHRSHMAFGVSGTWGEFPATHPVHLPELTEHAHWDNASTAGWYASSDMGAAPGSTFHADWFGGWHPDIQQTWLDQCIHGLRGTSGGNLCDHLNGTAGWSTEPMRQLRPPRNYTGPTRIPGYTPMVE